MQLIIPNPDLYYAPRSFLTMQAVKGDTDIVINSVSQFTVGDDVLIGHYGLDKIHLASISTITSSTNTIELDSASNNVYNEGTRIAKLEYNEIHIYEADSEDGVYTEIDTIDINYYNNYTVYSGGSNTKWYKFTYSKDGGAECCETSPVYGGISNYILAARTIIGDREQTLFNLFELKEFFDQALLAYSTNNRITSVTTYTTSSTDLDYTLPKNCMYQAGTANIIRIEYDDEQLLKINIGETGTNSEEVGDGYYISGSNIILNFVPDDGKTLKVFYNAVHTINTIPVTDNNIIKYYFALKIVASLMIRSGEGFLYDNGVERVDKQFQASHYGVLLDRLRGLLKDELKSHGYDLDLGTMRLIKLIPQ